MDIIEDPRMTTFFRRPHSKRKRIIEKWRKRAANQRVDTRCLWMEHAVICHPSVAPRLRAEIAALDKAYPGHGGGYLGLAML